MELPFRDLQPFSIGFILIPLFPIVLKIDGEQFTVVL